MYKIDKTNNSIIELKTKAFAVPLAKASDKLKAQANT